MKKLFLSLTAILLSLALAACSAENAATGGAADGEAIIGALPSSAPSAAAGEGAGAEADAAKNAAVEADAVKDADAGVADAADEAGGDFKGGDYGDAVEPEYGAVDGVFEMAAAEAVAGGAYDDYDFIPPDEYWENHIPAAAGTLTAGEWIDNDHITFWNDLHQIDDTGWSDYSSLWNRAYTARTFATVTFDGKPVENADVTVTNSAGKKLWTAKTDNEGKAYLFYEPSALNEELTVTAEYANDYLGETTINSDNYASTAIELSVNAEEDDPSIKQTKSLDLMLVVDTTGSMFDELDYLQEELESVINRAVSDNGNIPVRLSVNFYRDDGDEYVVRDFAFTENISQAIADLKAQDADGGGDMPEKVNAALDNAINDHDWNENSTKLLFIILDAPPHSEDPKAVTEMNTLTEQAAEKGIRIIPILASGGDKEAEYVMRDMAMKTGGTYLFLTDDSGVSVGGHIQPTVGDYEVEKLNDLMVKVINRYLATNDFPAKYTDEQVELIVEEPEITTQYEQ